MKNLLIAAILALGVSSTAMAAPINIGGVVWNPDAPTGGTDKDFTARFTFNQWFSSAADAIPDVDSARPDETVAMLNPGALTEGDVLQGVGEIDRINGSSAFCQGCELTVVFGGFEVTNATPGSESLSNGWLRVYVDDTPDFDVAAYPFDAGSAADGDLWLSAEVDANNFYTAGGSGWGFLTTFISVLGGLADGNLDTNFYGTSDLRSTTSALFEQVDLDGDGYIDEWIATASGEIKGDSIPEPGTLALLGIALVGAACAAYRKKSIGSE